MTTSSCKDCKAEADASGNPVKRRPAPHPGPRCASHWREVLKKRKAENHEKRVQDVYGLAKGEYASLYTFQGGLCALCRRATGKSRRLSVDHDHKSGDVRGLLCRPCNTLLGHARDKVGFFYRALDYLAKPPYARMKGGEAESWDSWDLQ